MRYILDSRLFVAEHFYQHCRPSTAFQVPLDAICFPHKICVNFVLTNFSRVECWLQEKLKTKLLQKFVGKKKLYYGEIESRTDRFTA